jgi:hypothetical protein
MKVEEGKYSVGELVDWFRKRELVVNPEYQRGRGLWPAAAKSYFIDTILREFPFPKVYFHERIDRTTRTPLREIVDGQQRLNTIVEFVDNKFALGNNAGDLEGKRFADLNDEQADNFFAYTVAVDVIRNATRSEILQMFRRMNAFTLPLNAAEKRHSEFFGEFKDWINTVLDRFGSVLIDWNVFTSRQVVRMADAEFVADLALAVEEGIVNTTPTQLNRLYRRHDKSFSTRTEIDTRIIGTLDTILTDLSGLQGTFATRAHVFHSLVCALIHNKWGLPNAEHLTGLAPIGRYFVNAEVAVSAVARLVSAYEEKDTSVFPEFVQAASSGGNRASQRATRIKWLCTALRGGPL